jgi:hypothetical protein
MAKLFILTILLISFSLSAAAQAKLDSFVTKYNIETDHVLTYAGDGPYADEAIETVQADKWKAGYVIAYTSYERKSYFFFTDEKFKKTSNEIELKDRIIEKVVTDNEELVFLTRNRIDFENRIISNTIYFTKISEKGEVELDVKIIGSENMAKAGESKLSDRATPQLAWTGMYYFA